MKREEYLKHLSRLPIVNPSIDDMAAVAPHISKRSRVLNAFGNMGSGTVAVPSTLVKGASNVLTYNKNGRGKEIRLAFTISAAKSGKVSTPFYKEAIEYAEANWRQELVDYSWVDTLEIHLMDPSELIDHPAITGRKVPRETGVLYVGLNANLDDLLREGVQDISIAQMRLNPFEGRELVGAQRPTVLYNCCRCYMALERDHCPWCRGRERFELPTGYAGYRMGLSPKMQSFVRSHKTFPKVQEELLVKPEDLILPDLRKSAHYLH